MTDADREILDHFTRIRGKTIEMLKAVPAALLGRTAAGESHRLGWQFAHIAGGVDWWMQHVMGDGRGLPDKQPSGKKAILAHLDASRDRLASFFTAEDGQPMCRTYLFASDKHPEDRDQWVGRNRVLYLTAHELHHLSRAELALWQFGHRDLPGFP